VKILDFAPHSRDTLTRGCLIFPRGCGPDAARGRDADCVVKGIAHAKVAKDAEVF